MIKALNPFDCFYRFIVAAAVQYGYNALQHASEDLKNNEDVVMVAVQQYFFYIYFPLAFCRKSCDPKFMDVEWQCRGTIDTCKINESFRMRTIRVKAVVTICFQPING